MRVLHFILKVLKPYSKYFIGMILVMVCVAAYTNGQGYFIKLMIDDVAAGDYKELLKTAAWYIALQMGILIVWTCYDFCAVRTNRMRTDIANQIIDSIKSYDIVFFQNNFSGSISSKIKDASTLIPMVVGLVIDNYFQLSLVVLISFALLISIHWMFAVALVIWLFSLAFLFKRNIKTVNDLSSAVSEADAKIWGRVVDYMSNILTVKYYAAYNQERKSLKSFQDEYNNNADARGYFLLKFYFQMGVIFWVYIACCMGFLIYLYQRNEITPGDFAFIFSINYNIYDQLFYASHTIRDFVNNVGAIDKAIALLDMVAEVHDKPDAQHVEVKEGTIVFDKVQFNYKGSEPLFQNKSVSIASREKIGLVGYSGSGKSTFVSLILRLYDVTKGRVLIDGKDVRTVTQDSLRAGIGMLPQDTSLFNRTMMENIRYSKLDATDEEVIKAAKLARAHDFIMKMPLGYNTMAGERGLKLSGGQRQRIAIARTILKNAPILILDEATSQLDSVTEGEIQETLWELMEDKTTIVIAHRLSTLMHMDRILVFEKGKIVADGPHAELIKNNDLYKNLWQTQVHGFLSDDEL